MPKFAILKEGVNEALISETKGKVEKYIQELFHDYEIVKIDDYYTFTFGTISVTIEVLPWHSEDVLVKVYSYLAENIEIAGARAEALLNLNSRISFGSFGITFEKQAVFVYSLAGKNLDLNEFQAAVQMVAKTADEFDEIIKKGEAIPV
ncbi:MAG TPA: hypothetical protein DCM08_00590 [Microscillaceae bacterium]|jgi:predicted RNA binding protein with dsRBD fold (UPF0201 family)|nr:hypothetical protein [Microscillaceae bacterium]